MRGEALDHVVVLGSAFEIAKHLGGEHAGGVDTAAAGSDTELFGCFVEEIGTAIAFSIRPNSRTSFCTWDRKSVSEWVTHSQQYMKNIGAAPIGIGRVKYRHRSHSFCTRVRDFSV